MLVWLKLVDNVVGIDVWLVLFPKNFTLLRSLVDDEDHVLRRRSLGTLMPRSLPVMIRHRQEDLRRRRRREDRLC